MKRRKIAVTGTIDNNGNLRMYMDELKQFFRMHKGCRVIAKFMVESLGSSEALKGYYYNCVVPSFQEGMWDAGERLTEEDAEIKMRELSPIMLEQEFNEETGKYTTRLREISELSNAELVEYIDHLKQIAAEEYSIYIEDPQSI
jgi:NurA-like 5'-3' nuclease